MGLEVNATMSALEELDSRLQPEILFEYLDVVNSVHKAIQYHMDMDFQLCFIGDKFPTAEVNSFFADYQKLAKKTHCVFVQFRQTLAIDFDRGSLKKIGFDTVISLQGNSEDKAALVNALQAYILQEEYKEVLGGLPDVVENLMKEVDKIALEKKRGKNKSLNTIYSDHLKASAQKFENLHQDYIDKLTQVTDDAEPFTTAELQVPEDVIEKKLPHLRKKGYDGQSHRVFDRLLKLHGDKAEKPVERIARPPLPEEDGEK